MTATANITSAHQPNATWNVNHAVSHQPNQRNGVFVSLIFTIMFAWNIESSSFERIFSLLRKDHIKKISPVFCTLVSAHTKKQQKSHEFFIETFSSTWNDTNKCYRIELRIARSVIFISIVARKQIDSILSVQCQCRIYLFECLCEFEPYNLLVMLVFKCGILKMRLKYTHLLRKQSKWTYVKHIKYFRVTYQAKQ